MNTLLGKALMENTEEKKEILLQLDGTQEQLKTIEATLTLIAKVQIEIGFKLNILTKAITSMVFKERVSVGNPSWAPTFPEVPYIATIFHDA